MLTINSQLNISVSYPLQYPYNWEDIIFFDIETTGLSAKTSYIYLIGCMHYSDNTWQITQWFADDLASERLIIEAFTNKLKNYKKIVHYNGTGFDIPFILQKCKLYQISDPFESLESYDIYKNILPFKKLLPIQNLKLKTVEEFMGFHREDTKSGEELIKIYSNFLGRNQYEKLHQKRIGKLLTNKFDTNEQEDTFTDRSAPTESSVQTSDDLLNMLLIHNKEDVQGLLSVSNILYYYDVFQLFGKPLLGEPLFHKYERKHNISTDNNTTLYQTNGLLIHYGYDCTKNYFNATVTLPFHIIKPISWSIPIFHSTEDKFIGNIEASSDSTASSKPTPIYSNYIDIFLNNNLLTIQIPIFTGELKYFFDNYKEYYYLPKEDIAIHKSVAEYVDKEFRMKAKPDTCYNRKISSFLPQTKDIYSPSFKFNYKDRLTFFEINQVFKQVNKSNENNTQQKEVSNPLNSANNQQIKNSDSLNNPNSEQDMQAKLSDFISCWLYYLLNSKETKIIS